MGVEHSGFHYDITATITDAYNTSTSAWHPQNGYLCYFRFHTCTSSIKLKQDFRLCLWLRCMSSENALLLAQEAQNLLLPVLVPLLVLCVSSLI